MRVNAMIESHIRTAEQAARKYSRGRGAEEYEELRGVALLALSKAAAAYGGPEGGFARYAYAACRNAILTELKRRRKAVSLDAPVPGTDGATLGAVLADGRAEDPAARHDGSRLLPARRNTVRLHEVEVRATSQEVGGWMAELRAACFDALKASDMTDIMKRVVEKARRGDVQSVKLILDYFAGGKAMGVTQTVVVRQQPAAPEE